MVTIVFYVFALTAILAALMCVTQRNPVAGAFWLVTVLLSLAGIFVLLQAEFIGVMQVLVYAGAIMVLFLFVIMLLNLGAGRDDRRGWFRWALALVVAGALTASMAGVAEYTPAQLAEEMTGLPDVAPEAVLTEGAQMQAQIDARGIVGAVAEPMFSTYMIPFQITGLLLLTAVVGAVVLAKRRL